MLLTLFHFLKMCTIGWRENCGALCAYLNLIVSIGFITSDVISQK